MAGKLRLVDLEALAARIRAGEKIDLPEETTDAVARLEVQKLLAEAAAISMRERTMHDAFPEDTPEPRNIKDILREIVNRPIN